MLKIFEKIHARNSTTTTYGKSTPTNKAELKIICYLWLPSSYIPVQLTRWCQNSTLEKKQQQPKPNRNHCMARAFGSRRGMSHRFRFQQGSSFPPTFFRCKDDANEQEQAWNCMDGRIRLPQLNSGHLRHSEQLRPILWGAASALGSLGFDGNSVSPKLLKNIYTAASPVFTAFSLLWFPQYCCPMAT